MNDLLTRLSSGIVFLALMISAIWFHKFSAGILFALIASIGVWEYLKLQLSSVSFFKKLTAVLLNNLLFLGLFISREVYDFTPVYVAVIIFCSSVLFSVVVEKQRLEISAWNPVVFSLVYLTFPFLALMVFSSPYGEYSYEPILAVFILLWSSDSGAYAFGRLFGKHKFLPKVSPKKTWEGFIGGVLMALLASWILTLFKWDIGHLSWVLLALVVSVFGAFGDLFQSQLKRLKGVKDSGNIMPGHGGVLDRFDGLLFCAPVIFVLEKLLA